MAECINCGDYTKFNAGLCYKCFESKDKSDDVAVLEKVPEEENKSRRTYR